MAGNAHHLTKKRRNLSGRIILACFLAVLVAVGVWLALPGHFDQAKRFVGSITNNTQWEQPVGYNARSLGTFELSSDDMFTSKNPEDPVPPASLAKLFVIDYATTLVSLDEVVTPSSEALALVKPGSSVANIAERTYTVENLIAAMLVPSGNDAAYALADYVGAKLDPNAASAQDRQQAFLNGLATYLDQQGYAETQIHDPSGYDFAGSSTVLDIKNVTVHLLDNDWFRNIVGQVDYTGTLPDGTTQTWHNTNVYLDPASDGYFNPDVRGVKTGSLGADFNLVVLYEDHDREFLIVSLGSQSDTSRYDDVNYVLGEIADSSSFE